MKILLIYASSGAGHKKAGQAIFDALKESPLASKSDVTIIDALDYTPNFFKRSYEGTYEFAVNYVPSLWGFFYYFFNNQIIYSIILPLRRLLNHLNSNALVKFILQANPDIIVFTHFFASEVTANLKKEGKLKARLITVVTDFGLHSFWVSKYIDQYLVASRETKEQLVDWGIAPKAIEIVGIPISPDFLKEVNRSEILYRLNLKQNLFTVLVGSGGFGAGPVEKIVKALDKLDQPLQVLVVCGKNRKLYNKIKELEPHLKIFLKTYGFVENMPELMSISQVMITKSGGLTCSEALAKKLPLIIISPIPGQERGNCQVLLKYNVAYEAKSVKEIGIKIQKLLEKPNLLNNFKERAADIANPNSARKIANLITAGLK